MKMFQRCHTSTARVRRTTLAALAALAIAFGFAACANGSGDSTSTADGGNTTTQTDGTQTDGTTQTDESDTPTTDPTDPANPSDPATPTTPETPAEETDPEVAENVVELSATEALAYIANMTESGTVRVTGELTNDDLNTLRTVLQEKGSADSDVRIALDLSAATVTSDASFFIGNAPSLVSLSLPRGLKMVMITECPSLVSLTFSDYVKEPMIAGCDSLQSVTLGKEMFEYRSWDFLHNFPALTEIKLTPSVTGYIVEDGILYTADKKTLCYYPRGKTATTFAVPSGVEKIDTWAFENNTNLTRVTMPSSVTTMGETVFSGCSALEAVVLSDALTSIEWDSFRQCSKLTAVTIPQNVLFIGAGAFFGCEALSRVDFAAPTGWYEANQGNIFSHEQDTGAGTPITVSDAAAMAEKLKNTANYGKNLFKPSGSSAAKVVHDTVVEQGRNHRHIIFKENDI